MRRRQRKHRIKAEMNVVPYIDVMLVLLVIFMIAAPLIRQQSVVKVDLPDTPADIAEKDNSQDDVLPLILSVDAHGNYYLNQGITQNRSLSEEEVVQLSRKILAKSPGVQVVVEGDTATSYDKIFAGITLLQRAGATSVGLAGEPPPKPASEKR